MLTRKNHMCYIVETGKYNRKDEKIKKHVAVINCIKAKKE